MATTALDPANFFHDFVPNLREFSLEHVNLVALLCNLIFAQQFWTLFKTMQTPGYLANLSFAPF